jgi:hypothetical protein
MPRQILFPILRAQMKSENPALCLLLTNLSPSWYYLAVRGKRSLLLVAGCKHDLLAVAGISNDLLVVVVLLS